MQAEQNTQNNFRFRKYAWKQFKKNKPAAFCLWVLIVLACIALLAPVLANERPLVMKYKGHVYFPAFSFANNYLVKNEQTAETEKIQLDIQDWKHLDPDFVVWAPVVYSPGRSDQENMDYRSPGGEQKFLTKDGKLVPMPLRFRHFLGTNARGEDVLAGLIYGSRISLAIGFLSMGIAGFIGLLLGSLAGFFGDDAMITSRGKFWTVLAGVFFAWYYGFSARNFALIDGLSVSGFAFLKELVITLVIFLAVICFFIFIGRYIGRLPWLNRKVTVPVDSIISRAIEILNSLPILILIISVAAIARPSLVNLMVIIGLTGWTGIARFTRAEFLRMKNLEYIQAARALGFSEYRTIMKHALPNGMAPALVSIAFGVASAILIESSLSFLDIGVPVQVVTWGKLLSDGQANFSAWWLVVFPGLAIFITVAAYNLIGEGLRDAMDPRQRK